MSYLEKSKNNLTENLNRYSEGPREKESPEWGKVSIILAFSVLKDRKKGRCSEKRAASAYS